MRLTIEVTGDTERRIAALAYITGLPMSVVASKELAGGLAQLENPFELLSTAIESYCDGPVDRFEVVQRFKRYRDKYGIKVEDYEIEAEVAEAIGEVEPGQGWLLVQAGRILSGEEGA